MLDGDEVFNVDAGDVISIRILFERQYRALQVSFKAERDLPDLFLYLEPNIRLRW